MTGRGEETGRRMASEVLPLPVGRSSMGMESLGEDMNDHLLIAVNCPIDRRMRDGMTWFRR